MNYWLILVFFYPLEGVLQHLIKRTQKVSLHKFSMNNYSLFNLKNNNENSILSNPWSQPKLLCVEIVINGAKECGGSCLGTKNSYKKPKNDRFQQQRAFLSCKIQRTTCIPRSRASNKISSIQTLSQTKRDFFCDNFASITASEETLPMIKKVSRDEPCSCFRTI